jgi:exopolysaccharide biosynthesis polyprenyl glycosylphosphotransferase
LTDLEFVHDRLARPTRGTTWSLACVCPRLDRELLLRRMLAAADIVAVVSATAILTTAGLGLTGAAWAMLLTPGWLVLAKLFGLYDRDRKALRHLTADELQSLFLWALTGTGALTIVFQASPAGALEARSAVLNCAVIFTSSVVLRSATRALWRTVVPAERAIILGTGPLAAAARRKLDLFPDMHVQLLDEWNDLEPHELDSLDGRLDGVDRVIVASQALDEVVVARLVDVCRRHRTRLSVVPPARGMFGTAVRLTHVAELPVVEYNTAGVGRSTLILKRALDIAVSAVGLVVLAPLLVVIGAALRATSRGPALFVQSRAGRRGRPFRMLKFRTMGADAEARLCDVVSLKDLPEPVFKLRRDPRVTRVGRVLRRTSLDELPQLFNVLMGDMSLVGPRPEQLDLVEQYSPLQRVRLEVKPGITGPMQVYGRGELTLEERLAVEREYIENLSLARDVKILALTASAVLTGRGAF